MVHSRHMSASPDSTLPEKKDIVKFHGEKFISSSTFSYFGQDSLAYKANLQLLQKPYSGSI